MRASRSPTRSTRRTAQGIVHRDLKPGNIMLTKGGAKLLDFGLAKLRPASVAGRGRTRAPPPTAERAAHGRGQHPRHVPVHGAGAARRPEADARTDIFAFGAVLYEMVTGQEGVRGRKPGRPHRRDPQSTTRRARRALAARVPPMRNDLVVACLAKDAEQRWQTAVDLRRQLRWMRERRSSEAAPVETRDKPGAAGR